MSVIIPWEHLLHPQRLPSGDLIRLTVRPQTVPSSRWVEFQLATAPRVTWLKRIRFFNSRGEISFLQTEGGNQQTAPVRLSTNSFNREGLRFELVKAMAFGVPTGIYELNNVGQWKRQLLFFEWLED